MTRSETFKILAKILAISVGGNLTEVRQILESEKMDWIRFVKIADRFLVLPAIFYNLKQAQLLSALPLELAEHLEFIYTQNKVRNRFIKKQLFELCEKLNAIGIFPTILKGGGNLIEGIYPDEGVRIMTDLDLLVSDQEFLRAAECILELGYKSQYKFDEEFTSIQQTKDYPRLYRNDVPADIEIHRLPVAIEFQHAFNYFDALKSRSLIDFGAKAYVLSHENNIKLNFIHGQLSDKAHLYRLLNLKNMYDLFLLNQKTNVFPIFEEFKFYKKQAFAYGGAMMLLFEGQNRGSNKLKPYAETYLADSLYYLNHPNQFEKNRQRKEKKWRVKYMYFKYPLILLCNASNRKHLFKKLTTIQWYKKILGQKKIL